MVADRRLMLILVAFHPALPEVQRLKACLDALAQEIGYVLVVNDYLPGEPVEILAPSADLALFHQDNPGYGIAVNRAVRAMAQRGARPGWLAALNTDLSWRPGTMEKALAWLEQQPDVVLAVPQICNAEGRAEQLCKRDPTVLALLSRRFWPEWCKPQWIRRYDAHYVMADVDLNSVVDVPYLSGCCMMLRREAFEQVGGFDQKYFLYLEDADLARSLRALGRCIHIPLVEVYHLWGRGNHSSWWLTLVNIHSAWIYFKKWGLALW